jgi:ABC-type lipoprotein export system ATPase subunit
MVGIDSGPVMVLSGIWQGFSQGTTDPWQQALSGASLSVHAGEVVAVIGGRGSGKTTLLGVAAGVTVPEAGSVRLRDVELTGLSARERGKLRGREVLWLNRVGVAAKLRVRKLVSWSFADDMGRGERECRIAEALERVGASKCAQSCWGELTGFEQVLVGYAQALAGQPRLVVIDDLLDGLGEPHTKETSDLLRSLIEDTSRSWGVLMSATDRESALYADRVWALERGRLIPTAGHRDSAAEVLPFLQRRAVADK